MRLDLVRLGEVRQSLDAAMAIVLGDGGRRTRARDLGRVATARSPSGEVPFSCWRGVYAFLAP